MLELQPIAIASLGACAATVVAVPGVRVLCRRLGAVDDPHRDARRVHMHSVVSACGLAVVLVVLSGLLLSDSGWLSTAPILGGLLLLTGVGLIDDVFGVRPWLKLSGQAVAVAAALWGADLVKSSLAVPLLGEWIRVEFLVQAFYLVLGIGMVNALNLIDGLDGLAGGMGLILCLGLAVLAFLAGNEPVLLGSAVLGGSLMGFLAIPAR